MASLGRVAAIAILIVFLVSSSVGSHFRFGIITWRPDATVTNKVWFQFKLAWRRSFSSSFYCDSSTISSGTLIGGGTWSCSSGCSGSVSSAQYYCTSYSTTEDWSQGERTVSYTFSGTGPFTIRFASCCWISLQRGGSSWSVQTEVNLKRRSNGKINSSPISATAPIIRLQLGCSYSIPVHTEDPDGDVVKCRWGSGSYECGGVCNALPGATLTSNPCTIKYRASTSGWFAVALMLEDFTSSSSSVPLSKVPLQFLIQVAQRGTSCGAGVKFASSTLSDNICVTVPPGTTFTTKISVTEGTNTLKEITIVAPRGMTKSTIRGTSPNKYVDITWTPTSQQYGSHVFCFTALDNLGITTSQRCVTIVAGFSSPTIIPSSQVPASRTVVSPTLRTFTAKFNQKVRRPLRTTAIKIYRKSSSPVLIVSLDTATSSQVSIVNQTLSFSLPTSVSLIPEQTYYITMESGAVRGLHSCTGGGTPSPAITSSTAWSFTTATVYCPPVDCPPYGKISTTVRKYNTVVSFSCAVGYSLSSSSSSSRSCQLDSTWTGSTPTCSIVNCGGLSTPTNGAKYGSSATFGSIVTFTCNTGYKMTGSAARTCQSNSRWSGSQPSCSVVNCGTLATPVYGRKVGSSTVYGGTATSFSCLSGYSLSGSTSRSCRADGTWSGTQPTCNAKRCSALSAPANGKIACGSGNSYGVKITFECNSGYRKSSGSVSRTCVASSSTAYWSGSQPVCTIVDCGKLNSPAHGTKSGTSTSYGATITFACSSGYRLSGSSSRTCRADGTWGGIQPTCEIQQCTALSAPKFGRVSAASQTYGVTLSLECYRGYRLTGSTKRTCAAARNGSLYWTGPQTVCTIVDCGSLPTSTNGFKLQNLTTYEDTISFSCGTGYILVGSSMRRCGADGRWDGTQPSCEIVDCGSLDAPKYGVKSGTVSTYRSVVRFSCTTGYKLLGSPSRICQSNGTWTGKQPICQLIDCGVLPTPVNGSLWGQGTSYGSSRSFTCDSGHTMTGSALRRCQSDGRWSGIQPICEIRYCVDPGVPTNGSRDSDERIYGSLISFTCDSTFTLVGNRTIECIETSINPVQVAWTASTPTCDVIPEVRLVQINTDLPDIVYSPAIGNSDNSLVVDCLAVKGRPTPNMVWTVDGQIVSYSSSSDVYERLVTSRNQDSLLQLVVQRFHSKQQGNYTCSSTNRAGNARLSFTLVLQVPPADPVVTTVKVLNGSSVLVSWHIPRFDGYSAITGYAIEYREASGGLWLQAINGNVAASVHLFIVTGLHPFTVYEFRVRARNKIGYGNYSSTSTGVKTIQTAPSEPRAVTVIALSAYSLHISWKQPDPANGVITGYRVTYTDESFPTTGDSSTINVNGSVHSIIVDALKPYRTYGVIVQAKTEEPPGHELWGIVSTRAHSITLSTRPSSPPSEVVATSGTTSIFIIWKAPVAQDFNGIVLGYRIEYNSSASSISHSITVDNSTFSFNLTTLAPHTVYIIRVYLINPSGESPASDRVVVKTGEAPPISAPYDISARPISSTSIEVFWSSLRPHHVPGILDGFDIYYTDKRGHEYHKTVSDANATSAVLTDLAVFSTYSITVAARTGGGIGPRGPSSLLSVKTMEDRPSSPEGGVSVTALSSTTIRVTWGTPAIANGIITGYVVFYWNSTFSGNTTITNASIHQLTVIDLNEFTDYGVAVAAMTGGGIGNHTVAEVSKTFEAVPSEPPVLGSVSEVLPTLMVVSWDAPTSTSQNGIIIEYEVRYNSSQFGDFERHVNVSANVTHVSLVDLEEYVTYGVQVRAYTAEGPGPFSSLRKITTLAVPSDPPTLTRTYTTSSTSVFLEWQPPPPRDINGHFKRYEVVYWEPSHMAQGSGDSASSAIDVKFADPGPGDATSFTLQGLEKYTVYEIEVRIVTAGNTQSEELNSAWSRSVVVQTAEDFPEAPGNFTTTTVFAHRATLSWKQPLEPNGIIVSFTITVVTAIYKLAQPVEISSSLGVSVMGNNTVDLPASHSSFQLTNLHAYSEYNVKIQARTSIGLGVSSWLLLETPQAAPSGPVRSIIAVTEPTASHTAAINVSWVPPTLDDRNGVVTAYRVTYYPSDGSAPSTVRFVSFDDLESNDGQENARSVVITNLDGHRPYEVFVSACVDLDDGKACGPDASVLIHTLETIPVAGPGAVDIIPLSESTVLVNWTAPNKDDINGDLSSYTVYVRYDKDGNPNVQVTEEHSVPANATSYIISGLDSTQHYIVGITAATKMGEGSVPSEPTDFTTTVHRCNVSNVCGPSEECYQSVKGHDVCLCPDSSTEADCLHAPEALFSSATSSQKSTHLTIYISSGFGGALLLVLVVAIIAACYKKRRGSRTGGFAPDDKLDDDMDYGELPPSDQNLSGLPGFGVPAMGQFGIANPVYDQFVAEDEQTMEEAGL